MFVCSNWQKWWVGMCWTMWLWNSPTCFTGMMFHFFIKSWGEKKSAQVFRETVGRTSLFAAYSSSWCDLGPPVWPTNKMQKSPFVKFTKCDYQYQRSKPLMICFSDTKGIIYYGLVPPKVNHTFYLQVLECLWQYICQKETTSMAGEVQLA